MLTAKDRIAPVFTITATIQGNGFSGVAKPVKTAFALDPKIPSIRNGRISVQMCPAASTAKNAIEMGGSFSGNTLREKAARRQWYSVRNANSLSGKLGCRLTEESSSDGISALNAV